MAEEAKEEAQEAQPAKPSGGGKLVVILVAVNLVATLGLGVVLFLSFQKDKSHGPAGEAAQAGADDAHGGHGGSKKKDKGAEFGKMLSLEQFTVNLATPGSSIPKYVRVNISLELPTPDLETEINQKMPQVRNAIFDLINSKRATDLTNVQGREFLKAEIRNALNTFLVTGKIKGIFFTNFMVGS